MLTQVYEAATPDDARRMCEIGIDHVGLIIGSGEYPRELPFDQAVEIAAEIKGPSKFLALFMSSNVDFIADWVGRLKAPVLHLGAHADKITPADVARLKRELPATKLMRSIPMTGEESIEIARSYENIADFLLLDSIAANGQFGALGVTHDWNVSRKIVEQVATPVILAGGLHPGNVAEAIRQVRPFGVDSFSKTNRNDGSYRKDFDLVRRFHEEARAALG